MSRKVIRMKLKTADLIAALETKPAELNVVIEKAGAAEALARAALQEQLWTVIEPLVEVSEGVE